MAAAVAQSAAPPAWQPELPALRQLVLMAGAPCTLSLDGCSAVREVKVMGATGLALTASRPLPQLAWLELRDPNDLEVPWQQLPALWELVLQGQNGAGLLEGATSLTSLRELHVDCSAGFVLPQAPGWPAPPTWCCRSVVLGR